MPTPLKSVVGLLGSFAPVIYCGYLVYYFLNLSGSLQEAENNGLGPTVLGLTIVGLLFCTPLSLKLAFVFIELRKPKPPSGPRAQIRQSYGGFMREQDASNRIQKTSWPRPGI